MSKLDITIPHKLTQEEALVRIKKLLSQVQQEHKDMIKNISEEWTGNEGKFSFTAKGFDIRGKINVDGDKVNLVGTLPMMLSFFRGKITDVIKDKAAEVLA